MLAKSAVMELAPAKGASSMNGGIERNVVASLEDVRPNQSYPSSIANFQWTF